MKKSDIVLAATALILIALAVWYVRSLSPEPPAPGAPAAPSRAAPPSPPAIRYPLVPPPSPAGQRQPDAAAPAPEPRVQAEQVAPAAPPLPALDESDAKLQQALSDIAPEHRLRSLFHTSGMIRRFVVTIDNLPGRQLPRSRHSLVRPTPGRLAVRGEGETLYLSADNFIRYRPFVDLVDGVDSTRVVAIYRRFYPLFQQAYEELGYPSGYFNDRLVDVIDHLLSTPDVERPIRLVRPHVLYRYADPALEALSAGQKVLIRIGPRNAARIKTKLRELRGLLVG